MARLKHRDETPPGGWRFLQLDTRLVIEGESFGNLVALVIAHRRHKGLQPQDKAEVGLEIERQICGRLTAYQCRSEGTDDDWIPVPADSDVMNMAKIKSFSESAWTWLKGGGQMVPAPEAERRAEICRACPANLESGHSCFSCTLGKLIRLSVPSERRLDGLKTCGFCGCELTSKVLMPESVILASDHDRNIAYPKNCWQREIIGRLPAP